MRAGDRAAVGPDRGFCSPAVEPPPRGPSSGSKQRHYRTGSHFGVLARDSCRHQTNSEPVAAHHPSPLVLARPVRYLAGPSLASGRTSPARSRDRGSGRGGPAMAVALGNASPQSVPDGRRPQLSWGCATISLRIAVPLSQILQRHTCHVIICLVVRHLTSATAGPLPGERIAVMREDPAHDQHRPERDREISSAGGGLSQVSARQRLGHGCAHKPAHKPVHGIAY
jgi:hypothetical protein